MTMNSAGEWLAPGDHRLHSSADIAAARDLITRYSPKLEVQRDSRAAVLAFIGEHPDALHRSCLTGHLTASCWVTDHEGGFGLILHHSKIQRWLQPGGHADGDANLAAVALKEASEETGIVGLEVWSEPIDIDIHLFVNRKHPEPDHLHHDLRFLVRSPPGAVVTGNHESEELRWIGESGLGAADLALDESTIRLAAAGFAASRLLRTS